jgi:DNA-binding response OmpR family regulator
MQDTARTVLVVEDDDGVRSLIRTLFRLEGFDVLSSQDGEEALDLARTRNGAIGLVITDINLGPDMDGLELAAGLRAIHPFTKVLYISGQDEDERLRPELALGLSGFLMKPFTPRSLTEKARSLLASLPLAPATPAASP